MAWLGVQVKAVSGAGHVAWPNLPTPECLSLWMIVLLMCISAQHVIPSHSRKYHTGNGDIVRTFYEYLCSHKDILYGSMSVMSCVRVRDPSSFRSSGSVRMDGAGMSALAEALLGN